MAALEEVVTLEAQKRGQLGVATVLPGSFLAFRWDQTQGWRGSPYFGVPGSSGEGQDPEGSV
jgi:hypothetical protein